jgi:hypothetical protein
MSEEEIESLIFNLLDRHLSGEQRRQALKWLRLRAASYRTMRRLIRIEDEDEDEDPEE